MLYKSKETASYLKNLTPVSTSHSINVTFNLSYVHIYSFLALEMGNQFLHNLAAILL